jgi:2-oxoglutarate dehydrogenase E1 component
MSLPILFDSYNAGYAQELYEQFARNPESVSPQWREIFSQNLQELVDAGLIVPDGLRVNGGGLAVRAAAPPAPPVVQAADVGSGRHGMDQGHLLPQIARAAGLIQAFRDHGHQLARIDPLGTEPPGHPQLDPAFFGTSVEDLAEIPASLILEDGGDEPLTATLKRLREIYCGSIGHQFEHLEDPHKVRWLWQQVESGQHSAAMTAEEKIALLDRLTEVEGLEQFLHRAYLGQKRFSIEGTDMLVPMLDLAIEEAARAGAHRVVLGMAHRGRLNVLLRIVGMEERALLREFEGAVPDEAGSPQTGTGDVKYHRGAQGDYTLRSGGRVEVTLAPNPSHLEFVNPVVVGMTRALQLGSPEKTAKADTAGVVPILIHGDAAFAAEGVVAEALNLARLEGFAVGGAVHIIVNNQVGFTTDSQDGRSTRYASDLAKGYDVPVLHVNADDPEACLAAVRLAMAYRSTYHDDVLIDLVGYRRYGHNEGDEPSYTQPLLYQKIDSHPTVRALWAARLVRDGVVGEEAVTASAARVAERLRAEQAAVQSEAEEGAVGEPVAEPEPSDPVTAVSLSRLEEANRAALALPDGFSPHSKLKRQLDQRRAGFGAGTELDWAHAESLAIGSILQEGVPVRLTGQDSERGTFSQRHLVLHDQQTGAEATPLRNVGTARFEVYNSALSEMAVLGFEYGYSVAATSDFVLWEAQFGDFVNVAQVFLDQFLASGRAKWGQLSRLTLLLPHGYEGQGPEHSSARLERFLQLCAEDNMRVAYPTTPAQYFHLLRRQALAEPLRPLVVMTPKSLLRHPEATSLVSELSEGRFRSVMDDTRAPGDSSEVRRVVLCSGKVYYDLSLAPERKDLRHLAIVRLEELYPFPEEELGQVLARYPNVEEVVWAQEEPVNMGALAYIGARIRTVVPREIALRHVARPERASPAEGRTKRHRMFQDRIVSDALGLD